MKLNFLFIVMDVLTVLAHPIVFVHTKLSQFSSCTFRTRLCQDLIS